MIEIEFSVPLLDDFLVRLLEVFWQDDISVLSDGLHTSFLANRLNICGTDLLGSGNVVLQVNFFTEVHFAGESLENQSLLTTVGSRELNFSVESAWSQEGRIKCVGTICGHDALYVNCLVKAVHLLQQLDEDTLDFSVCASVGVESLGGDRIYLVDEHDRRSVLLGHSEDISDHTRAFTEILLDELRTYHPDNGGIGLVGHSLCKHGFTSSWRSIEENTARWVDTDLGVELWMSQRKFDSLFDLLLLDIHTTDVCISDIWLLSHLHHLDGSVCISWQNVDNGLRRSVKSNSSVWLEILPVQNGEHSHVVLRSLRAADNTVILVNHLHEVTSSEINRLDSLDL